MMMAIAMKIMTTSLNDDNGDDDDLDDVNDDFDDDKDDYVSVDDNDNFDELVSKFGKENKTLQHQEINPKLPQILLNVPFKDKDDAKSLGARWDSSQKKWYTFDNNENLNELVSKFGNTNAN